MSKDEALKLAFEALKDMNCGWKYIRESHGDLYGVGWDRAQQKADDAIAALRQALEQPDPVEAAVLAEREACAKVCESMRPSKQEYDQRFYTACTLCANAIRARGENNE